MAELLKESDSPVVAVLNIDYPSDYNVEAAGDFAGNVALRRSSPTGSLITEIYHLHEGTTVRIGRAKTNDIIVTDRDVSRFHATFSTSASGVVLCDLASTNGTFVNGRRISTPIDLASGDIVTLGNVKVLVQLQHNSGAESIDTSRTEMAALQAVEVTVLLADVCGYTKISQDLPGEDVATMLRSWFETTGEIIKRHGGEIDKYIGDCVMALWKGTHANAADLALSATRAGVEIIEATKKLGRSGIWEHDPKYPWRCRAALNSGTALFGIVGAGDRRSYTVLGDAINVTFRIEGLAGRLGSDVVLSEVTAELIKESFAVKSLGAHDLEGRLGEMIIYGIA